MALLGFDTSTAASTAAVLLADGESIESAPPADRLAERPAHASELLPAIHDVLGRAGLGFWDLDAVAVGLGPGTFTGLRIGIATARALAKANDLPLRGVSSLAALAAGMPDGPRLPLIDAKRGEVYGALTRDEASLSAVSLAPRELSLLSVVAPVFNEEDNVQLFCERTAEAVGAMPFEMDAWGVDLVVSASQKAWMASPGISIAALSDRAWAATEAARMPRFYWDFGEARTWAEKGQTPWTPAISVMQGLHAALEPLAATFGVEPETVHLRAAAAVGPRTALEDLALPRDAVQ